LEVDMVAHLASPKLFKGLSRLLAAALAAGSMAVQALPVSGQGTWETTLQARDINGDSVVDAYYDTALNLTWLADWNANGSMNWDSAVAWAAGLDVYGVTGWRLPSITDTGSAGCDFSYAGGTDCGYNVDTSSAELAHMWYVTLGNLAYCPPGDADCNPSPEAGWGLTNTADFINMQSFDYWSGSEYAPNPSLAWFFYTTSGLQDGVDKGEALYAVAVRPGDVAAAAPEPGSLAILLAGLGALAVGRRRRPVEASALRSLRPFGGVGA
jgi:hypothetical protein